MCQIFETFKDLILGLHLPPLWSLLESGLFLGEAVAKYPEGGKGEARQSQRGVARCQDPRNTRQSSALAGTGANSLSCWRGFEQQVRVAQL